MRVDAARAKARRKESLPGLLGLGAGAGKARMDAVLRGSPQGRGAYSYGAAS